MSTRGAFGVKLNGKYYITYNHHDSYPTGLGQEIVDFCKNITKENIASFIKNIKKLKLVKEDKKPTKAEQKYYTDLNFYNDSVSNRSKEDWYCLLRHIQGIETLNRILDGSLKHLIDSTNFLKDSLFCEYAYIINLDTMHIEFYKGFNQEPDNNSLLPFEQIPFNDEEGRAKYYPVKFKGSCLINDIPDNWIEKFYKDEE